MINKLKLYWELVTKNVYQYNINYFEIKDFLEKKFPKCYVEITDLYKKTCGYKTLKSLAKLVPAKYLKWRKEDRDCEDISMIALGAWKLTFPKLPIGLCFADVRGGKKHALLCAVYKTSSERLRFIFIEPQTGKIFDTCDLRPYLIII